MNIYLDDNNARMLHRSLCSNQNQFIGRLNLPFELPHQNVCEREKRKFYIEVYYRDIGQFKWYFFKKNFN